jgi:hypothetical protein
MNLEGGKIMVLTFIQVGRSFQPSDYIIPTGLGFVESILGGVNTVLTITQVRLVWIKWRIVTFESLLWSATSEPNLPKFLHTKM